MLVSALSILSKARRGGYAVGAFNTSNLEITQGILQGAEKLRSPVIISTSLKAIRYAGGFDIFPALVREQVKNLTIPVALHLDHATDVSSVRAAIAAGYTSVMIDGSRLPFRKNVALTKIVVRLAQKRKVSVEGEIGVIGGSEDYVFSKKILLTSPEDARAFVKATGVHSLACAVGTAHGRAKGREYVDLHLVRAIARAVRIPLVLHGASEGISRGEIRKAIALGVSKVNIDTELRVAFTKALRKALVNKSAYDPRTVLAVAREAVTQTVAEKITLFGSVRKA